ncbi:MAG: hypothetical protein DSM106950_13800 [Stigonema ocellatum SAG 48.90 = DSM 106950]|nr:hypothetical protein [Stigonema ocellatum SAG 48.90 = DSM 106950]
MGSGDSLGFQPQEGVGSGGRGFSYFFVRYPDGVCCKNLETPTDCYVWG